MKRSPGNDHSYIFIFCINNKKVSGTWSWLKVAQWPICHFLSSFFSDKLIYSISCSKDASHFLINWFVAPPVGPLQRFRWWPWQWLCVSERYVKGRWGHRSAGDWWPPWLEEHYPPIILCFPFFILYIFSQSLSLVATLVKAPLPTNCLFFYPLLSFIFILLAGNVKKWILGEF